jgi:hypothetical protein
MVLGSADWVDRDGRIEQTRDGGLTWRDASDGLEVPWSHHMVERFLQIDERLLAVLSNGELLATPLDSFSWRQLLPEVRDIHAAAQLTLSL